MVTIPIEHIHEMRDALEGILTESASVINATEHVPRDGSIAHVELRSFERPISIKTAQDQSYLLLESAADYLSCLVKALTPPVESIAPWALARGVMESATFSAWIGRPNISASSRVRRSLALRLKGVQEQVRLARSSDQFEEPDPSVFENLVSVAREVDAEIKIGRDGRPTKLGTHLPSATDVCGSELGEETTYRILSAPTHSQVFALQQLSFTIQGASQEDSDRIDAAKHLSNVSVAFLCLRSGYAFLRALGARLKYYGYLTEEVVSMLRQRADVLRLPEDEFRYCIWSS